MHSFKVTAIGNLARDPELVTKGGATYANFCLLGNDYAGKDELGNAREVLTGLTFVAFGALGEVIAKNARKGDQLIVEAQIRANNWVDKDGATRYEHSNVVNGFRFGASGRAKREALAARHEEREAGVLEN